MPASGLGQLGLWLHLRGRRAAQPVKCKLPPGSGPILMLASPPDKTEAAAQICARLRSARPGLRVFDVRQPEMPDISTDKYAVEDLLDQLAPSALLLLGAELPPALIAAAADRRLPMVLGEARFEQRDINWTMQAVLRRDLLAKIDAILVSDESSYQIALGMGATRRQLRMTGPVTAIREPLTCNERERATMAEMLSGRHAWLAACIPLAEENAVLAAHRAALRQSHRALLFLVPTRTERIAGLAADIEATGLLVARRDLDEDPVEEVQVMLSDGPTEMGLWYRLAPVTYMGGTLSGHDTAARHPFEPASLGSAIIHGPAIEKFATQWQQLDGAQAARRVLIPSDLADAVAELSQPDLIAALASNAWTVSTGGAGVAMQIAQPVLDALAGAHR